MQQLSQLKSQLQKGNVAFLLGNGINRYNDFSNNRSWEKLLLDLHNRYAKNPLKSFPEKGISCTEFYDLILLDTKKRITKRDLQREFVNSITNWNHAEHHTKILNQIRAYNAPVLTTNFDDLLPRSINAQKFFTVENRQKEFTDYYPWQCYYSTKPLNEKLDGFSIWFLHGVWEYQRSIKLGLTDYVGNSIKAKEFLPIKKREDLFFKGENTWLKPFFTKSLCIIGFGLNEQEMFLRWLLLQRALNFKRNIFPATKSWYITFGEMSEGKKIFLQKVGIETVEVKSFKYLYETMWKELLIT
jgi:hypothetical protein